MKSTLIILFLIFLMTGCTQKYQEPDYPVAEEKLDTIPVDSFSNGAISVDVARKIRMSSLAYQDSLKKAKDAAAKMEQEKKQQAEVKKNAEKAVKDDAKSVKENPDNQ